MARRKRLITGHQGVEQPPPLLQEDNHEEMKPANKSDYKRVQIDRKPACQPLLRTAALEITPRITMRLDSRIPPSLHSTATGWIGCESLQQCLRTCSLYNNKLEIFLRISRRSAFKSQSEYLASQMGRDL